MGKWTIHKFISMIAFIAMTVIFFIWSSQQVNDLALFFGIRTSHTVANDIAGIITSLGAVPGDVSAQYRIYSKSTDGAPAEGETVEGNRIRYDIDIFSKSVCVTSRLGGTGKASSDCATHPFDLEGVSFSDVEGVCVKFSKKMVQPREEGKPPSTMEMEEC